MPYYDDSATRFDQPFDQDSNGPTIDAGVDTIGLSYNPKTGTFQRTGSGSGGGGLPSGGAAGDVAKVDKAIGSMGAGGWAALPSGAGNALSNLGGMDWKDILALIMGGASAFTSRGPSEGEQRLDNILGIAESRINDSTPLFQYLNTMAKANLPKYARGEP